MSTPAPEVPPATEPHGSQAGTPPATPPPGDPATPPPAQEDGATDWKAEARKWEQRAKENAAAKKALDDLEEAAKTDLEKATARAEKAEAEMAAFQIRELRREVADAKGLPSWAAARLTGTTKAELEADADQFVAHIGQQGPPNQPPDPIQGRTRGGEHLTGREHLARSILAPGAS